MSNVYHMVHYRRLNIPSTQPAGSSLEKFCRDALSSKNSVGIPLWQRVPDRLLTVADVTDRQLLLNKVVDFSTAVFGEMCLIQSQGLQALLALQASKVQLSSLTVAEIYGLQENAAPVGTQFIRGMAYWLAVGNHLFFVKTQSMTAANLRYYLAWLLANTPLGNNLDLQAEFDKSQLTGDIGDIQRLRVSGVSAPQVALSPIVPEATTKDVKTSRTVADRFVQFGQALPVVEALFGKPRAQSLVESLGPEEYLAVDASVKVRGKRTTQSRENIRALANDVADMTEGKVQIEGKDGTISDDDAILRTRMPFSLVKEGSSLLDFDHVATQLQEVYSRFVQDGKINS